MSPDEAPRQQPTASEMLAQFSAEHDHFSAHDLHVGRRALLDTLACAIAGRRESVASVMDAYAAQQPGSATIWTTGRRTSAEAAALANGTIGHVLDYDDVTSPMRGHPSVVMLPALVALAEAEGKSADDVLRAFAVGLEGIARIGRVVAIDHVAKGWHSTYALGVLGVAMAGSRLLGLGVDQTTWALGLSAAQAGGMRANFGTMAKSFQAGQAAAAGLRAVTLARLGCDASEHALDGSGGFTELYGCGESLLDTVQELGMPALETTRSGLDVKRYPNCYAAHRSIDALLALRARHGLSLGNVRRIEVRASRRAFVPLTQHRPRSGLEGKFSLEYAMAAVLADGTIDLDSFTDEKVLRPRIQDFIGRVSGREDDSGSPLPRWAEVRAQLDDDSWVSERVETLRGSAADPLTDDEIVEKLRSCCRYSGYECDVDRIAQTILRMDRLPMSEIVSSWIPKAA